MSDWTAERLDELHVWTVIAWAGSGGPMCAAIDDRRRWHLIGLPMAITSEIVIAEADPGSIRVVSVPVDALTSHDALEAAFEGSWVPNGWGSWSAELGVRAAIAHVTGVTNS